MFNGGIESFDYTVVAVRQFNMIAINFLQLCMCRRVIANYTVKSFSKGCCRMRKCNVRVLGSSGSASLMSGRSSCSDSVLTEISANYVHNGNKFELDGRSHYSLNHKGPLDGRKR